MSASFAHLNGMDQAALLKLAVSQGLTLHHKLGKEKIIKAIIDHSQPTPTVDHPKVQAAAPVVENTEEEVEAALVKLKERVPALRTSYLADNTWLFQWVDNAGRVRREESGNLAIPLRVIVQKASNVAQGPISLRAADPMVFDRGNAGGKSEYTNNVLLA